MLNLIIHFNLKHYSPAVQKTIIMGNNKFL